MTKEDLNKLSIEELKALAQKSYDEALKSGKIDRIAKIARCLGVSLNHNYGPRYSLDIDGLNIYVDDYGHYMRVRNSKSFLCSTHKCEKTFKIGGWEKPILDLWPQVEEKIKNENIKKSKKKKKD